MHRYTEEQKQFIIDNNYGKYSKELADLFNQRFNTNITAKEIKYFRTNYRLNSGLTGRFEKGHKTWNKGLKGYIGANKTSFKKGNIPHNYRPVGSERINIDGYYEVKVADPNVWELKHRYIWEQTNGKIPKGHKLIFLDGNRNNVALENLKLISDSENLIMNNYKLRYTKQELTKSGILISKVIDKVNKVKNERL